MKPVPWSLLDPGTRLEQIAPCGVLIFTDDTAHHLTVKAVPGSGHVVEDVTRWAALGRLKDLSGDVTLAECAEQAALRGMRDPRFMLLPGVVIPRPSEAWHLLSLLVALAVLGATAWLRDGWVFAGGFPRRPARGAPGGAGAHPAAGARAGETRRHRVEHPRLRPGGGAG